MLGCMEWLKNCNDIPGVRCITWKRVSMHIGKRKERILKYKIWKYFEMYMWFDFSTVPVSVGGLGRLLVDLCSRQLDNELPSGQRLFVSRQKLCWEALWRADELEVLQGFVAKTRTKGFL